MGGSASSWSMMARQTGDLLNFAIPGIGIPYPPSYPFPKWHSVLRDQAEFHMILYFHAEIRDCSAEINRIRKEEQWRQSVLIPRGQQEPQGPRTLTVGSISDRPARDREAYPTFKNIDFSTPPHAGGGRVPRVCGFGRIPAGAGNTFGGAYALARSSSSGGNSSNAGTE
jgi:hypothetical protein